MTKETELSMVAPRKTQKSIMLMSLSPIGTVQCSISQSRFLSLQ
jgi:hypothetical protein